MSSNTVARIVDDIAKNKLTQLLDKNRHLDWFYFALHKSIDVPDTSHVLLLVRGIDKNYEVYEELLYVYVRRIHGTTTADDILKGVENAVQTSNEKISKSMSLLMVAKTCVEKMNLSLLSYQRP